MGKRGGSKKGERRGGRKKGSRNKATLAGRQAIAKLVDGNAGKFQTWLTKIADGIRDPKNKKRYLVAPDPRKAFDCLVSVLEFHIPKLGRTELLGPGGGPIQSAQVSASATDEDAMKSYLRMLKLEK